MKFLLRLKHWQLFILTWGLPFIIDIFTFSDPELMFKTFPIMMLVFMFAVFGWVWAISTGLNKKLPPDVKLNLRLFKILFSIPIIYILLILFWMGYHLFSGATSENSNMGIIAWLLIFLHLFSMVCIFLGIRFAAKTIKSIELGRLARFSDYSGDFFLIWFSIIGIWILQPRLNKLTEE